MPVRTAISHAVMGVVLLTLWVSFSEMLETVIGPERIRRVFHTVAVYVAAYADVSIGYGKLVSVVAFALLTIVAFAWGYVFHVNRFGR